MAKRGRKERWDCWESNPVSLAYCANALSLSYSSHQQSPVRTPMAASLIMTWSWQKGVGAGSINGTQRFRSGKLSLCCMPEELPIIQILFKHCCSKQSEQIACTLSIANLQLCWNRDALDTKMRPKAVIGMDQKHPYAVISGDRAKFTVIDSTSASGYCDNMGHWPRLREKHS